MLFENLYNNWLFFERLNKYYNTDVKSIYKFLLESQYWNIDNIRNYQHDKLCRLIEYAKVNIPYYNYLKFPQQIDNLTDILVNDNRTMTKKEIQQFFNQLYNKTSKKEFFHKTSGSSGDPLTIISSNISEANRLAQRLRFYNWWGILPDDNNALIWGQEIQSTVKEKKSVLNRFKAYLKGNTFLINVFELNRETIHELYKQLIVFKPKYLRGYASAIFQFASLLESEQLDTSPFDLKVVITTSEILLDNDKNFIEKIFNTRVADEYGAAEIGLFAYDCPEHGAKHVCEELICLNTNLQGEVIVTDLHNFTLPLINYSIGDKVVISDKTCKCGRSSRIIEKIEGRTGEQIIKTDGDMLSQYLFYYIAKELDNIGLKNSVLKYKIIQSENEFTIYLIKGPNFNEKVLSYYRERMYYSIGKSIIIEFIFVESIPLDKSGKMRFFQRIK